MKNAKSQLKKALKKTTRFMLSIEENSSDRVPEWYDQMALMASHNGLTNSIYESLFVRLKAYLKSEYGSSATKFILS